VNFVALIALALHAMHQQLVAPYRRCSRNRNQDQDHRQRH